MDNWITRVERDSQHRNGKFKQWVTGSNHEPHPCTFQRTDPWSSLERDAWCWRPQGSPTVQVLKKQLSLTVIPFAGRPIYSGTTSTNKQPIAITIILRLCLLGFSSHMQTCGSMVDYWNNACSPKSTLKFEVQSRQDWLVRTCLQTKLQ